MTEVDEERAPKRQRNAPDVPPRPPRKRAPKRVDPKAPKLKKAIEAELREAIKGCLADGRKCSARLALVTKQAREINNPSLVARAIRAASTLSGSFSTVAKAIGAVKSVRALIGL